MGVGFLRDLLSKRTRSVTGIVVLGRVTGDVSIFDPPGAVTIRVERGQ